MTRCFSVCPMKISSSSPSERETAMTFDPTHHDENKELEEAQENKEQADPDVEDPAYMPNIEPQTGDSEDGDNKEEDK